jgi:uncharacterized protein YdhG (YjbR/CyaY superfamily)
MRAGSVEDYLASVDPAQQRALEALRKTIRAAAPAAEECISYGIPAFRLHGMLVGFGATKKHCAFYVMSGTLLEGFAEELKGHDISKGTIRFQPGNPLPAPLVKKLVKARIAENAG